MQLGQNDHNSFMFLDTEAQLFAIRPVAQQNSPRYIKSSTFKDGRHLATLYLLRHAKAGWAQPGMRDFDRPLDETGNADSETIGEAMAFSGYIPELTLCSGAARARQTLSGVLAKADAGKITFVDQLYITDAAGYLDMIRDHSEVNSLLVIGHNPMMEDLALALTGEGDEAARSELNAGFPTAGLAVIEFPSSFAAAAPGKGRLEAFVTPAHE